MKEQKQSISKYLLGIVGMQLIIKHYYKVFLCELNAAKSNAKKALLCGIVACVLLIGFWGLLMVMSTIILTHLFNNLMAALMIVTLFNFLLLVIVCFAASTYMNHAKRFFDHFQFKSLGSSK